MATISKFSDQQQRKSQVNLKILQVLDLHVGPLVSQAILFLFHSTVLFRSTDRFSL